MPQTLKLEIQEAMKAAMRAKEKQRLGVIRMMLAGIKQREIDERIELDDEQVLLVVDKMVKQRRESFTQFEAAGRDELAAIEAAEIEILKTFMLEQLSPEEIQSLITTAISETGASSVKDMGKVMGLIKPKAQGRADMSQVSKLIKAQLGV